MVAYHPNLMVLAVRFRLPQPVILWQGPDCYMKKGGNVVTSSGVIAAGSVVSGVVTSQMMTAVMSELVGTLPVVIPAVVVMIGVRKAVNFVLGMLRSA